MERRGLAVFLVAGLCAVTQCHIRKYYYVETPMTFTDAQKYCREKYTDLATVDSQTVQDKLFSATVEDPSKTWIEMYHDPENWQDKLINIVRNKTFFSAWIGLYRDQPYWQWSSREEVTFYNWKFNRFCAKVNVEGTWEDDVCNQTYFFMCYTDTDNDTQRYTLIRENRNWTAARDYCREQHTGLVTIRSPRENDAVMERGQGSVFWIGLFNDPWKWSNGGESLFRNWAPERPSNVNRSQACVLMEPTLGNMWSDASCSITTGFICCDNDTSRDIIERCSIHTEEKIWYEAQKYCRAENKDLATIYTEAEARQLTEVLGIASDTWIGLYHGPENWQWVSGERASYANWKTNRFCAAVDSEGYWEDLVCDEQHSFMCYTETSNVSQSYTLINEGKTWAAARDYCQEHHTDLVTIRDHSENKAVRERAGFSNAWIGLFNEPWKWSDQGKLSFRNWNSYEPNNFLDVEKCAGFLADGKWNDCPCWFAQPFCCEEDMRDLILVRENKTWEEALDHCRSQYTDLTSIISEKEHNLTALMAADAQTPHVWLGLRQSFITHSWFWVNREVLGYKKWVQAGQPQCPQSGYCGAMSNTTEDHAWTDRPCEEKLNFICYRA